MTETGFGDYVIRTLQRSEHRFGYSNVCTRCGIVTIEAVLDNIALKRCLPKVITLAEEPQEERQ